MIDLVRNCLGFRLGSAYRRIDRLFNRAYAGIGLPHAHGQVLACLLHDGEMRLTDIAARTGFDRSTVSHLVKELARRKLIRRREHPDDRRAVLLSPAKRGEALRDDIERIHRRINAQLRSTLTDADVDGFLQTLRVMDQLP